MKIGILYVGIGKYIRLWDKFYSSCESLFLPQYEKKYFIFTDYPLKSSTNVQVSFQEDLGTKKNSNILIICSFSMAIQSFCK